MLTGAPRPPLPPMPVFGPAGTQSVFRKKRRDPKSESGEGGTVDQEAEREIGSAERPRAKLSRPGPAPTTFELSHLKFSAPPLGVSVY